MRKLLLLFLGLCMLGANLYAQNLRVTGRVTDLQGLPLPNVSVVAKGQSLGTSTNESGEFQLTLPTGVNQIVVSNVGFASQTIAIVSGKTVYNVVLSPEVNDLENVVVTGYTREKRSNFVGASTKIDAKAINQVPIGSFDQIMQGRVPGMLVQAGSGQPGSSANVIIRGTTSISGATTPLYVMDGIPIEGAAFASISPSDIESIDVLRDAGATALYGSRGSNGVIVITTKRGKSRDKVQIGVKSQYGVSVRTRPQFVMMNAPQRLQFEEEEKFGPGWSLSSLNPANGNLSEAERRENARLLDSLRGMDVDWTDIFFRNGKFQEHEISASGGTQRFNFYTSINYFKQEGIALRSGLERYSLRNNLDFKTDRLTVGFTTSLNYSSSSFIESENSTAVSNPFAAAYYALPYEQPYINGVLVHPGNSADYDVFDLREGSFALERLLATTSTRNELKGILGTNINLKITEWLSAVSTLGLDFQERNGNRFIDPNSYTGSQVSGRAGSYNQSLARILSLTGNAGLRFSKTYQDVHSIEATALYESIKRTGRTFSGTGFGINPLLGNTPAAITPGSPTGLIPLVSGSNSLRAYQSAVGILRYTYDGRYNFNFNLRRDGASIVGPANRWQNFYSFGLGWNVMRENFMQNLNAVDELKLRSSYGLTASPFPTEFGYLTTYQAASYDGQTGLGVGRVSDPNYDWEYTKQLNIGLDFGLLKNRLRGTIEFYNKLTNNLFIDQRTSATGGVPDNTLEINAGKMRNRGLELLVSYDLISNKNLLWSIGGNVGYNKNVITDLGQVNEYELGTSIVRVGLPYGSHYIPLWAGVDQSTGNPLYFNRDKSVTTTYNAPEQSVAESGSWLPKYQGGFNSSLNYKGFSFDVFFSFSQGAKRFNNEDFFNENQSFITSNQSVKLLDRWRRPGDVTNIQRMGTPRQFSSKDIQDASFLRLRNINLGYNLPKSVIGQIKGVEMVRIYAQAQNLLTWTKWTGFDPEDSNNISAFEYPLPRTFTFGINVTL